MAPQVDGLGNYGNDSLKELSQKYNVPIEILEEMSADQLQDLISAKEKLAEVDMSQLPDDKSVEQFNQEENQKGFWQKPFGKALKVVGGAAVLGGLVAVGRKLPKNVAKAVGLGALGIVTASTVSSCRKEEIIINNNQNTYNEDNVAITIDLKEVINSQIQLHNDNEAIIKILTEMSEIIARLQVSIQEGNLQMTENLNTIMSLLTIIIDNQNMIHTSMLSYLQQILEKLSQMDENQQANSVAILRQLQNMQQTDAEHFNQLMEKLDELQALGVNMMSVIQAFQNDFVGAIETLTNLINELKAIAQDNGQTLQQILAKINQMDVNMQQGFWQLLNQLQANGGSLEEIQAQLQHILNAINNMNDDNSALLQQILGAVNDMNANVQLGIAQILAKLDDMSDEQRQQYLNLMAQLQNMDDNMQANFVALLAKLTNLENGQTEILNAMQGMNADFLAKFTEALAKLDTIEGNQATQIAQLAQIYADIQSSNAQLADIKTLIENLNINPQVNLDVIEGLLREILASQNTTNNLLADMNETQHFILQVSQTLQEQMTQVTDNQEVIQDWLVNIFNKIPEAIGGCNCEECCAQVIEILIQIDEHIQELDWNHEGIDDDFDDLLG